MSEKVTLTLEVEDSVSLRLELACKELERDASDIMSEAFSIYFRKLITDGKITADVSYITQSSSEEETEYSLDDETIKVNPKLTVKDMTGLTKAHLKNYEKAMNGDPKAQNVMGTYYESGNGLPKNYDLAIYWYTLSAEQGNTNAQYHLGVLWNKAHDNPLKAYYWFEVARMCGFNLTAIHRDYILRLTERLSARQMKLAQEKAEKKYAELQKEQ